MKINVPFFVFDVQWTVASILEVIFRSNPFNKTRLDRIFVPRSIETKEAKSSYKDGFASAVKMWANGVYINAVSEGYSDTQYGNHYRTVVVTIKTQKFRVWDSAGRWVRFDVPVRDILQAEKNLADGLMEEDPQQVKARTKQAAAVKAIHDLLQQ